MAKKACKYWYEENGLEGCIAPSQKDCPKKLKETCQKSEAIKPKHKKIKAWAMKIGHTVAMTDRHYMAAHWDTNAKIVPCTILIDRKYLKELK